MNDRLRNLLQDADPVRHEAPRLDAERERIRKAMLEAWPDRKRGRLALGPLAAVAALAIASTLAAGLAYQLWARAATPVLAAVRFEMRLAEEQPIPGSVAARVGGTNRLVHLHPEIVVNNDDIADAAVLQDGPNGFGVSVQLLAPGAARMRQATAGHLGRPVAILIDGIVAIAPVVRSPIADAALISGGYTRAEAERIASGIGGR
jgi:hypothetical protein